MNKWDISYYNVVRHLRPSMEQTKSGLNSGLVLISENKNTMKCCLGPKKVVLLVDQSKYKVVLLVDQSKLVLMVDQSKYKVVLMVD